MIRQLVDGIVIDRERRVGQNALCPQSGRKNVQEMLENERTHLMSVPPTGHNEKVCYEYALVERVEIPV